MQNEDPAIRPALWAMTNHAALASTKRPLVAFGCRLRPLLLNLLDGLPKGADIHAAKSRSLARENGRMGKSQTLRVRLYV